ncbi:dTDP-4-dehydrorhamnose reductase [Rhodoferax sp. 4810]|uniref:dTDP-4-dehydrorhamnose reductase n=1 Tax=Thiospirillum jenense TaxID=1653858 RepID=A0A839HF23_9GAMM|nr:dTDP-4-dehydrorhamnose reductase [Thiospirillum jenense]MBB1073962.1 dTDP-4-dehydrorhamnose reductase [Rhodoferax jenense]MBB1125838.1 dTDP-4-dehydrorhamnose reductase [Thiospirillum jenense]
MTNSNVPRILLIGSDGQVGWELRRSLATVGQVIAASLTGQEGPAVDLSQPDSVHQLFDATAPDVVVNAAAYTAVDRAETEPELALAINGTAVAIMAERAAARGIPVVHYSTDFVFSGDTDHPYREDDEPQPLNVYGQTKLAGERALLDSDAPALIFRTAWVYGVRGNNFLLTMRRLFREQSELRVVNDQFGTPTWSRLLAEVTAQILYRVVQGELDMARVQGLYHVTSAGATSWLSFAEAIRDLSDADCRLLPIASADYQAPARRPAYSVLDTSRFRTTFGLTLPDWRHSLALCLADLR